MNYNQLVRPCCDERSQYMFPCSKCIFDATESTNIKIFNQVVTDHEQDNKST